jgi:predicted NAD/FAD-binding protein
LSSTGKFIKNARNGKAFTPNYLQPTATALDSNWHAASKHLRNRLISNALQKAVFWLAKHGLLEGKR